MGSDPGAAAAANPPVAHQDPMNGGDGWHRLGGIGVAQELMEFPGAPAPDLAELQDLADHGGRSGVRASVGPMGAIGEAVGAELGVAIEPFVAGLAADAVASAELGKGTRGVLGIEHETLALVHG
jgi:hypothetical protein